MTEESYEWFYQSMKTVEEDKKRCWKSHEKDKDQDKGVFTGVEAKWQGNNQVKCHPPQGHALLKVQGNSWRGERQKGKGVWSWDKGGKKAENNNNQFPAP